MRKGKKTGYPDKVSAEKKYNELKGFPLVVQNVDSKGFTEFAPNPYDLKSLQKDASRIYKISPERTLEIAQALYERHKLISYPRTDCDLLSEDEAAIIKQSVELAGKMPSLRALDDEVRLVNPDYKLIKKYVGPIKGHYAIIPTLYYDLPDLPKLSADEANIFELICIRLLLAFFPPATGDKTTIKGNLKAPENNYSTSFKIYNNISWKGVMNKIDKEGKEESKEKVLLSAVEIRTGDSIAGNLILKNDKTEPQKNYNDSGILSLMENAHKKVENKSLRDALREAEGIGTAATRSSFIPLLIKRGYIEKDKTVYVPTGLGLSLYKILPEDLKKADFFQ